MKTLNIMFALITTSIFATTASAQYMAGNPFPQNHNMVVVNTPGVRIIKQDYPGWRNDKKIIVVNNDRRNECCKRHHRGFCNHRRGGYKPPMKCCMDGRLDRSW